MKKQKLLYILGIGAVIVLGYLNYFSNETLETGKETVIETKQAKYTSEEYKIDAENQKDYVNKKETIFEKAKATLKDTLLSGDSVILDSARNLILKSNILGKTSNGWSFKGEDLKYDKNLDEIQSDTGIEASNEELGIKIRGDKFRADSKMTEVALTGNVVVENSKIDIEGNIAKYSNTDKKLELSGEVKLVGKDYPEKLMGEFGTLLYDGVTKELTAEEKFSITYGEILFSGNYFNYNQEKDTLLINKDLVITGKEYTITLDRVEKSENSEILDLKGKIVGTGTEYSFSAENGRYNLKTKELELLGDVVIKNLNGDEFKGERILYSEITGILQGFGELEGSEKNKELIYRSGTKELRTKYLHYDSKTSVLTLEQGFNFKDGAYFGTGEKLTYNREANDAILKNVEVNSKDRKIVTSEIDYRGNEGRADIPEEFTMTSRDGTENLSSKKGVFYTEENRFETEEDFIYKTGDTVVTGTGIVYDTVTGAGESVKGIRIENSSENSLITGDRVILQNKERAELLGNIKFSGRGYKTSAEKAIYLIGKNSLEIPERVKIVSEEKTTEIEMDNPKVDLTKSTVTGKNFLLKENGSRASFPQGTYNYKTGGISGEKVKIVTDKNETFTGNRLDGNLQEGVLNVSGDVKGRVYEKNEPIDFSGNLVKIYLTKGTKSNGKVEKVEIRENSTIKNKDTTLYSKNIDIDLVKNIAIAYPNPKAVLKDSKNGDTEVTSERANFNMNENKIYLTGGVDFKNVNPEKGTTTGIAGSGVVDTEVKTIELKENPVIDSPDAIIRADKMIYNSVTRKVNATGEVVVDYKEKK